MPACRSATRAAIAVSPRAPASSNAIRRDVYATLRADRPRPAADISPRWQGMTAATGGGGRRVPLWAIAAGLVAVVAGSFFVVRSLATDEADAMAQTVLALDPAAQVTIERADFAPMTEQEEAPRPSHAARTHHHGPRPRDCCRRPIRRGAGRLHRRRDRQCAALRFRQGRAEARIRPRRGAACRNARPRAGHHPHRRPHRQRQAAPLGAFQVQLRSLRGARQSGRVRAGRRRRRCRAADGGGQGRGRADRRQRHPRGARQEPSRRPRPATRGDAVTPLRPAPA